ncbi:membrane protein [Paenibacillus marchantiophytorum]|uniref:Membrane protein n=1 Tax=Paenibacillus marchantiophytorum TaxID=1619310 RepID=A0ABQ2BT87_9BACL|nr:HupE/UreJ family protein [Paenibacillus marchantiophytorum]GGI47012.1 membrane protein [Paenibacillus marchantiophytorum]
MYRQSVSKGRLAVCLIALALLLFLPFKQAAYAHAYSASYATLDLTQSQTRLTFAIDELSVIELAGGDTDNNKMLDQTEFERIRDTFADVIKPQLTLKIGGQIQAMQQLQSIVLDREGDASKVLLTAIYPPVLASQNISLKDTLYQHDTKTNYVNLLTIHYGTQSSTAALSAENRSWAMQLTDADFAKLPPDLQSMPTDASQKASFATDAGKSVDSEVETDAISGWYSFFMLGIHHILGGYDHLLFLFSLLIARQTYKQYATMITAFTIAHSLTLTLTVLNIIAVPPSIVEPLIALSICYVAIDNIVRKSVSYRWLLTFLFGLIHGMGFADILKGMNIPKTELATDLISFNLGIETVQLIIVAIFIPLLYMMHRVKYARKIVISGSALALLLGGIWLVQRVFET